MVREDISQLQFCLYKLHFTVPIAYMIPDEMMSYLNMFGPWVLNLIFCKIDDICVVTH